MNLNYHLDSSLIQLDFDLSIPVKGMTIMLMDIQGKILSESLLTARERGQQHENILLHSSIPSGAYFLQFRTEKTMFTYPVTFK
jgi:hypothetical protein